MIMSALESSVSVASSKNSGERNFSSSLTDDKKSWKQQFNFNYSTLFAHCIDKHL